jgi:hypothetical protein
VYEPPFASLEGKLDDGKGRCGAGRVGAQFGEVRAALRRQECLPHVFWVREIVLRKLRLDLGSGECFL